MKVKLLLFNLLLGGALALQQADYGPEAADNLQGGKHLLRSRFWIREPEAAVKADTAILARGDKRDQLVNIENASSDDGLAPFLQRSSSSVSQMSGTPPPRPLPTSLLSESDVFTDLDNVPIVTTYTNLETPVETTDTDLESFPGIMTNTELEASSVVTTYTDLESFPIIATGAGETDGHLAPRATEAAAPVAKDAHLDIAHAAHMRGHFGEDGKFVPDLSLIAEDGPIATQKREARPSEPYGNGPPVSSPAVSSSAIPSAIPSANSSSSISPSATTQRNSTSSSDRWWPTNIPTASHTPSSMYSLNKRYSKNIMNALGTAKGNCTANNAVTRQSWSQLTDSGKQAYLDAVQCLNRKIKNKVVDDRSAIHTVALRYRIDDFVFVHTEWSFLDLFSGTYFHWHRWLLRLYEEALQEDCGYSGTLPYWDFAEHANDITKDPIFSNGPLSLGGNGEAKPHGWVRVNYFNETFMVPPGSGGGCVSGPLQNYTARLGLTFKYDSDINKTTDHPWPRFGPDGFIWIQKNNGYEFNERCVTRDLNSWTGRFLNATRVEYDLDCEDIGCLINRINGITPGYPYPLNLVNTARFAVGGLQMDALTAPNDPIYWLIQTNIDRLFSLWQGQSPEDRVNQTAGKHNPWSRDNPHPYQGDPVKLDEVLTIGPIDPLWTRKTDDFKSTIDGPLLCYYYDSH